MVRIARKGRKEAQKRPKEAQKGRKGAPERLKRDEKRLPERLKRDERGLPEAKQRLPGQGSRPPTMPPGYTPPYTSLGTLLSSVSWRPSRLPETCRDRVNHAKRSSCRTVS